MARALAPVEPYVGRQILLSKLEILKRAPGRRPNPALALLTGRAVEPDGGASPLARGALGSAPASYALSPTGCRRTRESAFAPASPGRRTYAPRTVYLSEQNLRDLEAVLNRLEESLSRRPSRSAALRRAIDLLARESASVSSRQPASRPERKQEHGT